MSSVVFAQPNSYINIGVARAWREHFFHHTFTAWIRTASQAPACIVSLTNETHEVFSVDMNIVQAPAKEGALVKVDTDVTASRLRSSVGGVLQKAPPVKALRPRKDAPMQGFDECHVAGGVRIRIEDDYGSVLITESPLPTLADDRWHLLSISVDMGEVTFLVDGNRMTMKVVQQPKVPLRALNADFAAERIVYPSNDLIGGRIRREKGTISKVTDVFCGRMADIAVTLGGPRGEGPKLHWWVTEKLSGTTLWDRGYSAQHPNGLPLHLCNCAWDYEDFPAAALFLNGYEGRRATVPELTPSYLEKIANEASTPTPSASQAAAPPSSSSQTLLEATISLCGNNEVAQIPVSNTIHREYVDRVRLRRKPILISLSLRTVDDDPSIVLSIPFKEPLHLVLNLDCKPSVALVQANHAFVAPAVITDGAWHHVRWMLDSKAGASLYVDGQLAGWQYHTLPFSSQLPPKPSLKRVKSELQFHVPSSSSSRGNHNSSPSHHQQQSQQDHTDSAASRAATATSATADATFQEALRRRSFVVSMSNLKKTGSLLPQVEEPKRSNTATPAAPSSPTTTSLQLIQPEAPPISSMAPLRRRQSSVAFLHDAANKSNVTATGSPPTHGLVPSTSTTLATFAASEEELFGSMLQHIIDEEAELLVSTQNHSTIVISVPPSNAASVLETGDSPLPATNSSESIKDVLLRRTSDDVFSMQGKLPSQASFVLLSIKKRREILRVLEEYFYHRSSAPDDSQGGDRAENSSPLSCTGTAEQSTSQHPSAFDCVSFGSHFEGELRDIGLSIGAHKFLWRFTTASGRSVECNALSNEELFDSFCGSLDEIPGCTMQLHGASVVFPKVLLPVSAIVLRSTVTLDLGPVRLPLDPTTTGVEITFFAQLRQNFRKGGSPSTPSALSNSGRGAGSLRPVQTVGHGHLLAIEDLLIFELQSNRVQLVVPVVVTEALLRETFTRDAAEQHLAAVGETHLVCLRSITSIFEDLQWHAVHVIFPKLRSTYGVQVFVDGIALEFDTSLHISGPNSSNNERRKSADRRGSMLVKRILQTEDESGNELTEPLVRSASSFNANPSVKLNETLRNLHDIPLSSVGEKRRLLIQCSRKDGGEPLKGASQPVYLAHAYAGGNGFHGSIVSLNVSVNGQKYSWPLTDAARCKLSRFPIVSEQLFKNHPKQLLDEGFVPMQRPFVDTHDPASDTHWVKTAFPSRALYFDGLLSFVSAVNLRSNFHISQLMRFAVSLWVKLAPSSLNNGGRIGCLFSVHDSKAPLVEANAGIFTHCTLDTRSAPKKRVIAPFKTCFILVDTCHRTLCLETDHDIYDNLWHRIHWVVYDAPSNETHVFIDDVAIPVRILSSDHPREFLRSSHMVLNLGARNEGDNEVVDHFHGEIRHVDFARDVDDQVFQWAMDEGEGEVLRDGQEKITGCVWAPQWRSTDFPPKAPFFAEESRIEFSPVGDLEEAMLGYRLSSSEGSGVVSSPERSFTQATVAVSPLRLSESSTTRLNRSIRSGPEGVLMDLSLLSSSSSRGSLLSVLSSEREVLFSLVLNEGGDHSVSRHEIGTHTIVVQRLVEKDVDAFDGPVSEGSSFLPLTPFFLTPDTSEPTQSEEQSKLSISLLSARPSRLGVPRRIPRRTALQDELARQRELRKGSRAASLSPSDRPMNLRTVSVVTPKSVEEGTLPNANSTSRKGGGKLRKMVVEEVKLQFHNPHLTNGLWHQLQLQVGPDPLQTKLWVDGNEIFLMHISTRQMMQLPLDIVSTLASLPAVQEEAREKTSNEKLRDKLAWASMVIGSVTVNSQEESAADRTPGFIGYVRNFCIRRARPPMEHIIFFPFASTTAISSLLQRDVATSSVEWTLAVSPSSVMYFHGRTLSLSRSSYVTLPPLPKLNMSAFRFSFLIRTQTFDECAIVEFGHVERGYFCLLLNQDAFGQPKRNCLHFGLGDAEGNELHAECYLGIAEHDDCLIDLLDGSWHDIAVFVLDSAQNNIVVMVDNKYPVLRYATCGHPSKFLPGTDGGTVGAIVNNLRPSMPFHGNIKHMSIANLVMIPRDAATIEEEEGARNPSFTPAATSSPFQSPFSPTVDPMAALRKQPAHLVNELPPVDLSWRNHFSEVVLAFWEMSSAFGSILSDRSGNGLHCLAVRPTWVTDIRRPKVSTTLPKSLKRRVSTFDLFPLASLYVSRWSNNTADTVSYNPETKEVVMEEFPTENGWISGVRAPQWISMDFRGLFTITGVEIDLFRAVVSQHQIQISRSNLAESRAFHRKETPLHQTVPQATVAATFRIRTISSRTMSITFEEPLSHIRWMRVTCTENSSPVAYAAIRVFGYRGESPLTRSYSIVQSRSLSDPQNSVKQGEPPQRTSSSIHSFPQKRDGAAVVKKKPFHQPSLFPETFELPGSQLTREAMKLQQRAKRQSRSSFAVWHEAHRGGGLIPIAKGEDGDEQACQDNEESDDEEDGEQSGSRSTNKLREAAESSQDLLLRRNEEMLRAMFKTTSERTMELKHKFYTIDVNRTGFIDLVDFIEMFQNADITGQMTDMRVLGLLRDVGVTGSIVSFEDFQQVFTKIESW